MAAFAAACGGSSNSSKNDGGIVVKAICTAGAKSCLNDQVAVICTADGAALIGEQCATGQICTAGACAADPNQACTSAQNTCMSSTVALQCAATGKGFNMVTCPANTTCTGGACSGTLPVGAAQCANNNTAIQTSTDGFTFGAPTACPSGQLCVDFDTVGITNGTFQETDNAKCLPSTCSPSSQCGTGNNIVCGNPNDATVSTQTAISTCTPTPNGWQWVTSQCASNQQCLGNANNCGGLIYAACENVNNGCTQGQKSCDGSGYDVCGADGNYDTFTSCATTAMPDGVCETTAAGVTCVDSACQDRNAGVCDSAGKYHACKADGTVDPTATACAAGVCARTGHQYTDSQGYVEGSCQAQCTEGSKRCLEAGGSSAYQTCTGGTWGTAVMECANGAVCNYAQDGTMFCGDCQTGDTQCDGNGYDTCVNGTWSTTPTACTMGVCQYTNDRQTICRVQCVPNGVTCGGNGANDASGQYSGTTGTVTCGADGVTQTAATCATGTICRTGPSGNTLGCVECVGTANQYGQKDTRCTDSTGTMNEEYQTGGYLETCGANNTWDATTLTQCAAPNTYCIPHGGEEFADAPAFCDNDDD